MSNRNYRRGRGFEYRRLNYLLSQPNVISGKRFYGSKGICDIYYVKDDGSYHEEQCKYTSNPKRTPYISTEEFTDLIQYALKNEGKINVYLTSGRARQPTKVWKLN